MTEFEMKAYTVGEIIGTNIIFPAKAETIGGVTYTLPGGTNFKNEILRSFINRTFLTNKETVTQAAQEFQLVLNDWYSRRSDDYMFLLKALQKEYDPLSNYDRRESGGWTDARSDSRTASGSASSTSSSTASSGIKTTTNNYQAGDNSTNPLLVTRSEIVPDSTTPDSSTATTSSNDSSTDSSTGNTTHTFNGYRVSGNIGVTSSIDLLTGELNFRANDDLTRVMVREFIDAYTVYI